MEALGHLGDPGCVPALLRALPDASRHQRARVVEAAEPSAVDREGLRAIEQRVGVDPQPERPQGEGPMEVDLEPRLVDVRGALPEALVESPPRLRKLPTKAEAGEQLAGHAPARGRDQQVDVAEGSPGSVGVEGAGDRRQRRPAHPGWFEEFEKRFGS